MALTADRNTAMRGTGLVALAVAAGTRIYAGSLVAVDVTGFAIPGKVATSLTYAGRAEEAVDNMAAPLARCVSRSAVVRPSSGPMTGPSPRPSYSRPPSSSTTKP